MNEQKMKEYIGKYAGGEPGFVGAKATVYGFAYLKASAAVVLISPKKIIFAGSRELQTIDVADLKEIKVNVDLFAADIQLIFEDDTKIKLNIKKFGGPAQKDAIGMFVGMKR